MALNKNVLQSIWEMSKLNGKKEIIKDKIWETVGKRCVKNPNIALGESFIDSLSEELLPESVDTGCVRGYRFLWQQWKFMAVEIYNGFSILTFLEEKLVMGNKRKVERRYRFWEKDMLKLKNFLEYFLENWKPEKLGSFLAQKFNLEEYFGSDGRNPYLFRKQRIGLRLGI